MLATSSDPAQHEPGHGSTAQQDLVQHVWAAVSIRVAWELYCAGVRPSPQVLSDAREHVFLSLPEHADREQAEELASWFVREYLDRVLRGRYRRRTWPADLIDARTSWRDRLCRVLDPLGTVIFRMVYGDGVSLDSLSGRLRVDRAVLRASQAGVRGALRSIMASDGVSLEYGDARRTDQLLFRLATLPGPGCLGGEDIVMPDARAHVERCPRCTRGVRLLRSGLLTPSDLLTPADGTLRPTQSCAVLALHLHPDARHHRAALATALGSAAIRADDDTVLVDLARVERLGATLWELAEEGTPARHHLRGSVVHGPGRWVAQGLLGPVASAAVERTRSRPWGEVDTVQLLPEPLPPPPSAGRWWAAATLAMLMALSAGLAAAQPDPSGPVYSVELRSEQDSVRFDAHDLAYLAVVSQVGGELVLVHQSTHPSDKGELATGVGDYAVEVGPGPVLVASAPDPFTELAPLLAAASLDAEPLEDLVRRMSASFPGVDVRMRRRAISRR